MSDPKVDLLAEAAPLTHDYTPRALAEYMLTMSRLAAALSRWPSPDDEAAVTELALAAFDEDNEGSTFTYHDRARAVLKRLAEP